MVKKRKKAIQATFLAWMAFSGRVVFWEIYPVKTSENVFHLNVEIPLLTDDAWQDHIFAVECIFSTQGNLESLGHLCRCNDVHQTVSFGVCLHPIRCPRNCRVQELVNRQYCRLVAVVASQVKRTIANSGTDAVQPFASVFQHLGIVGAVTRIISPV